MVPHRSNRAIAGWFFTEAIKLYYVALWLVLHRGNRAIALWLVLHRSNRSIPLWLVLHRSNGAKAGWFFTEVTELYM